MLIIGRGWAHLRNTDFLTQRLELTPHCLEFTSGSNVESLLVALQLFGPALLTATGLACSCSPSSNFSFSSRHFPHAALEPRHGNLGPVLFDNGLPPQTETLLLEALVLAELGDNFKDTVGAALFQAGSKLHHGCLRSFAVFPPPMDELEFGVRKSLGAQAPEGKA